MDTHSHDRRYEVQIMPPKRLTWLAVRIAAGVTLIIGSFGYAFTGVHTDVLIGAGCGVAFGVGVGLRGRSTGGQWTGILIGSMVGIAAVSLAGALSGDRWGLIIPTTLALAVGLISGIRGPSLVGYRDLGRETFIMSVLLALGLLPYVLVASFRTLLIPIVILIQPFLLAPWTALMVGFLSRRREGWQDARPPRLLVLGAVAVLVVMGILFASEVSGPAVVVVLIAAGVLAVLLVALPAGAFLLGRAVITWLQPRLQVYARLADYLRVMWVPIGGFAVGYLTIIALFAGFYGTLERFRPGSFAGAGTGITDWLSFAFFTALGQDFATVAPVSVAASVLVGIHLIFSAGWALVLFAAVMSSIRPKLDRIAQRLGDESRD